MPSRRILSGSVVSRERPSSSALESLATLARKAADKHEWNEAIDKHEQNEAVHVADVGAAR